MPHVILNPRQHRAPAEDLPWPRPPDVQRLNGTQGWAGGTGEDAVVGARYLWCPH